MGKIFPFLFVLSCNEQIPCQPLYMARGLWQFGQMGLLPEYMEFPAVNLLYSLEYCGEYSLARQYAGQSERCVKVEDGARRLCLLQTGAELRVFGPGRGSALHILLLQSFARLLAGEILPARLREMGQKLNFREFAVRIGDQRRRWGSCSMRDRQRPKICLNWRGLLLTPKLLDQLCLHELCHLVEMNHSPAFHALLAAHNPQERQDERELGLAWKNLPPWAVHHSHFVAGRTRE